MDFVRRDCKSELHELLKHEDYNAKNNMGETVLMIAFMCKDAYTVKKILEIKNLDINAKDNNGNTALIHACSEYYNYSGMIRELLRYDKSIDINVKNKYGLTALMVSCYHGFSYIVRELLQNESLDYNAKNMYGNTALMILISNRYGFQKNHTKYKEYNKILTELLGLKDLDCFAENDDGDTTLEVAHIGGHDAVINVIKERIYKNILVIGLPNDITGLIVEFF